MNLPANFIPPLENGDQLSRAEFERRYDAMPHLKKAELIEGMVYMAPPLRVESHAKPHAMIMGWLATYWAATPMLLLADNATVRLDHHNEVQPDAILRLPELAGGKSQISPDDYLEGSPELIVEIAASTVKYDLHHKRQIYQRCGVQEYLVWSVQQRQLIWWSLQQGQYQTLQPDINGLLHSQIFPGLILAVEALLNGDLAGVLAELQKGLQTPERLAFVEHLSK